jgi:hypothetical protein
MVAGREEVMAMDESLDVDEVLGTTVRTVRVGATAYLSPRQTL